MELNEEFSAILQNKLPTKLEDSGSFTIIFFNGSLNVEKVLTDLGTNMNLIPYKMFKEQGLREPKPTRISIQIADRSIKYLRGIIEDVLFKVDKVIFTVDFIILDMDEDIEVPMILGRPFLATARTIIDVGSGELVLRVGDEEVTLQARDVRFSSEWDNNHYSVDVSNHTAQHALQEITLEDVLELYLVQGDRNQGTSEERTVQLDELDE
ncbi:uncharacterized protein LOC108451749 [Gossypium arboreum]|uniref:uncharacterized protein LOC108451749 n=1 Tax=Gossypium arboreum TaxID=29729 RepID=UPI000819683C|nr:uncharacterized protein LOC108451749 [Gossypium arboreum]